jgi:hypothetical protein
MLHDDIQDILQEFINLYIETNSIIELYEYKVIKNLPTLAGIHPQVLSLITSHGEGVNCLELIVTEVV